MSSLMFPKLTALGTFTIFFLFTHFWISYFFIDRAHSHYVFVLLAQEVLLGVYSIFT
jgi:hypothetical protein